MLSLYLNELLFDEKFYKRICSIVNNSLQCSHRGLGESVNKYEFVSLVCPGFLLSGNRESLTYLRLIFEGISTFQHFL